MKDMTEYRAVAKVTNENIYHICERLNELLVNEFALFTKTLNFHWNITGGRFLSIHRLLEENYQTLLQVMDDVAERVRILGETPIDTLEKFSRANELKEVSGRELGIDEMLGSLFEDHLKVQDNIKTILNDETLLKNDHGTEDFLVSVLRKHEMISWTLKSHLD